MTNHQEAVGARGRQPVNSLSVEGFIQKTMVTSPEGSEEWVLIEKENTYQQDYEMEEKDKRRAHISPAPLVIGAQLERKMIHIEVIREDGEEVQMESFQSQKVTPKDWPSESKQRKDTEKNKVPESSPKHLTMDSTVGKEQTSPEKSSEESPEKSAEPSPGKAAEPSPEKAAEPSPEKAADPSLEKAAKASPEKAAEPEKAEMYTFKRGVKAERHSSKSSRERRPQSLNLGISPDFVYETKSEESNIKLESDESDEDNNTPGKEAMPASEFSSRTESWMEPMPEKIKEHINTVSDVAPAGLLNEEKDKELNKINEDDEQKPIQEKRVFDDAKHRAQDQEKKASVEQQEASDSVNGPVKNELERRSEVQFEIAKVIMIDNRENKTEPDNDSKQKTVFLHEKKISNIEQESAEEATGRARATGHGRREITRIVPLKSETAKSQRYRDDTDIGEESEVVKRQFKRYSMNESLERQFDSNRFDCRDTSSLHISYTFTRINRDQDESVLSTIDHNIPEQQTTSHSEHFVKAKVVQDEEEPKLSSRAECEDLRQLAEGTVEALPLSSRTPGLQKSAPPAPPVKSKKARESGLILRAASREPAPEAAWKKHGVTPHGHFRWKRGIA